MRGFDLGKSLNDVPGKSRNFRFYTELARFDLIYIIVVLHHYYCNIIVVLHCFSFAFNSVKMVSNNEALQLWAKPFNSLKKIEFDYLN